MTTFPYQFGVTRDGRRFLMFESVESAAQPSLIYVVLNCLDGVPKAKVPPVR